MNRELSITTTPSRGDSVESVEVRQYSNDDDIHLTLKFESFGSKLKESSIAELELEWKRFLRIIATGSWI